MTDEQLFKHNLRLDFFEFWSLPVNTEASYRELLTAIREYRNAVGQTEFDQMFLDWQLDRFLDD